MVPLCSSRKVAVLCCLRSRFSDLEPVNCENFHSLSASWARCNRSRSWLMFIQRPRVDNAPAQTLALVTVYMGRNKLIFSMCTRFWRLNLKRRSTSSKTQEFSTGAIHFFQKDAWVSSPLVPFIWRWSSPNKCLLSVFNPLKTRGFARIHHKTVQCNNCIWIIDVS